MKRPQRARVMAALGIAILVLAACSGTDDSIGDATDAGEADTDDTNAADAGEADADSDAEDPDGTEDEAAEPTELTELEFLLNWTWYPGDHAYFAVAQDQGFFEDEGLDVSIQEGTGSGTTLQLLGTGQVPLGLADAATYLLSAEEIDTLSVIGVMNQQTPLAAIFKAEKGYETVEDLRGQSIAITSGDAAQRTFRAVLESNGMTEDDVEYITTANPAAKETAVLQDQADVLLAHFNEQAPRLQETADVEMDFIRFADAGVNLLNLSVIANTSWLEDNTETAEAFLRALARAMEWTGENPSEAAAIFSAAHQAFSPELSEGQLSETLTLRQTPAAEGQPYLWSAEEDWASTQQLLIDFAGLTTERAPDEYFTNEYIE